MVLKLPTPVMEQDQSVYTALQQTHDIEKS